MKILFDGQSFDLQEFGGVSRYFAEIIENLPSDISIDLALHYSNNKYLTKQLLSNVNCDVVPVPNNHFIGKGTLLKMGVIKNKNYLLENKELAICKLKEQDFDIFHPTYYDDYFLQYIGKKPFVLTIHDMIHDIFPEMNLKVDIIKKKAKLAQKAKHIIAVSENTKKDIINFLEIPEDRITVIHHGSSFNKTDVSSDKTGNYILYVGGRGHYKNFLFFVRSIIPLLEKDNDLKVICVGKPFERMEKMYLESLGIRDQFETYKASDVELYGLYNKARVFVYPSVYEGFGIPILEAFSAGCPVVASNNSCFPEVAADAALYFDPKNPTSIRQALEKVIYDPLIRGSLIEKGTQRLKFFSWTKAAWETMDVYRRIIDSSAGC